MTFVLYIAIVRNNSLGPRLAKRPIEPVARERTSSPCERALLGRLLLFSAYFRGKTGGRPLILDSYGSSKSFHTAETVVSRQRSVTLPAAMSRPSVEGRRRKNLV